MSNYEWIELPPDRTPRKCAVCGKTGRDIITVTYLEGMPNLCIEHWREEPPCQTP